MTGAALSVFAPAKINLSLRVVGKRGDGYHLLDSLVVFAGVGDWISVTRAEHIALSVSGPFAGDLPADGGDNLVLRAAHYLAAAAARGDGAHITLEKNLPVASGIGGGSSDAAAALIALSQLWGENLAELADADIAARLGADVPVCLRRAPTFLRGIGDQLSAAPDMPAAWLVLVNPGRPLATKAVFNAFKGPGSAPAPDSRFEGLSTAAALAGALAASGNDLAAPAIALMPEIADILRALEAAPECLAARMSGSGPTCFGLFADGARAGAAAEALRGAHRAWWVAAAPLL